MSRAWTSIAGLWIAWSIAAAPALGQSESATPLFETSEFETSTALGADDPGDAANGMPAAPPAMTLPPPPKPVFRPPAPKPAPPQFPGPKVLPPTGPYKVLFFENDFSKIGQPGEPYILGEEAKLLKFELFDTDFVFSTGGELRHRYMNQKNRLQPGGPGQDTYQLWRWRHYFDLRAGDTFRFYVEGLDATSFGEDLPPQATNVNRWDLLNAFVDIQLFETETGSHTLRYGRQELLFGRQRLVSPLDWANIRRNFEGVRYMVKDQDWRLDAFAVNPINAATGYRDPYVYDNDFDKANRDVWFSGIYFTYTAIPNVNLDLYWLWLDDSHPVPARADGRRHTIGSRYTWLLPIEDERVWDFDVEAAYQFGSDNGKRVNAGFATGILGHTWKNLPWTPRLSGLAYYGSGDVDRSDGQTNTFDVLFPLAHAYWALSDNLTGQNLVDLSTQLEVKPTPKTAFVAAYHSFRLANNNDTAYNVVAAPIGAPNNGVNVGNALDLYGYYAFNPNFDIQAGYSWFWYGSYIERTTPRGDATQIYLQTSIRY